MLEMTEVVDGGKAVDKPVDRPAGGRSDGRQWVAMKPIWMKYDKYSPVRLRTRCPFCRSALEDDDAGMLSVCDACQVQYNWAYMKMLVNPAQLAILAGRKFKDVG
jgi:hypothetical protein